MPTEVGQQPTEAAHSPPPSLPPDGRETRLFDSASSSRPEVSTGHCRELERREHAEAAGLWAMLLALTLVPAGMGLVSSPTLDGWAGFCSFVVASGLNFGLLLSLHAREWAGFYRALVICLMAPATAILSLIAWFSVFEVFAAGNEAFAPGWFLPLLGWMAYVGQIARLVTGTPSPPGRPG